MFGTDLRMISVMPCFLAAKVAVQIVDYYNMALGILEQSGSDDCSIAETVGSKIYKVFYQSLF